MSFGEKLDRAIVSVFPTMGLARVRAKAQAKVLMNYDAASRGRRTHGWKAPGTSADAAGYGSRARLRNLARDMVRNREYAHRGVEVISNNVVGSGIMPSVTSKRKKTKTQAETVIKDHLMTSAIDAVGVSNFPVIQGIVLNAVVTDGEVLVRRRFRSGQFRAGLAVPFQIEVLECDYLDDSKLSNGQNEVIEGVEYGPTGEIVAYWLYRQHPGTASRNLSIESARVPASEIIHVRRVDRPGQTRGVTWFAPVMLKLGELADYQEGEILKQKIAALMAAVVSTDADPAPGEETGRKGIAEIGPGSLVHLDPGESVTFSDPPTITGYEAFMRVGTSAVAVGLGITYESLSGDLKGVNFSSGRMGRMEMDRNIEKWQTNLVIEQLCVGVERWTKESMALVRMQNDFEITWTPPRRALVDPTKEIPALEKKVEAGFTSTQRTQRELGLDPEVIHKERLEDAERAKELAPEPIQAAAPDEPPATPPGDTPPQPTAGE